mmetsp:Transcript_44023/g.65288  ORF Transcript_44023/g.65288 Transcript_44023/m.65288 type:complete len:1102 (-) Transcript_44023:68-3373(-)|eukprot:CAMPEP_0194054540 /NCGR_PEP_ID=MMETSP0009_2-20130614/53700_1 /TAXON_ID=210454 /ORGANISM="Grammatophora oceanica, Strain CCMP 410" /LENGTH=1101 /DNA_ID=CAMNT_0038703059 /DNA_START=26 /DNA_END=3331 /DNA_ORIENTATION=+
MGCCQSTGGDPYDPYAPQPAPYNKETVGTSPEPVAPTPAPKPKPKTANAREDRLIVSVSPSQKEIEPERPKQNLSKEAELYKVYKKGKQLGYGAFATVFIGKHVPTGKEYAIKKIDRSKMMWGDRDALEDEISNLKTARNGPHIVKLYEEYYISSECFLVMELMRGGELFDRIIEKRTFTEKEARDVTVCMLEALQYMHQKRVVHRDLKPENLLLPSKRDDTNIKLADFGFAKRIPSQNGCRTLCGTPGYLAPEILERWPSYDTKCDLWSVGVILFLLLGGYLPFEDENEDKVFDRTRNGHYDFHRDYWGGVSRDAKELVTKCLTVNPSKRISAPAALEHKWMTAGDHLLQNKSLDTTRLESTVKSAKAKMRAAITALVVANRLQELNDDFHKYLENKRELESNFSVRRSMAPRQLNQKDDSESGKPFEEFYEVGELLGAGGFASVYRGKHKKTFQTFAVKIVDHSKLTQQGALDTLKDEIGCLKLLRGGPHIVRLHDVFEGTDMTHMILEEMKGGELLQRIVDKEVYTEREARATCKILFDAMDYIHKKRIAHRDIKPENLLLVEKADDTSIKIADFGFAKKVDKPNCLKTLCGTAAYVAPEVLDLKSKGYDERADMWSCGVVTYILLGGYAPFEGPLEDLAITILKGDYEFHQEYWHHISDGAKNLVSSLLQVNPNLRITAEEALQNDWMTAEEETLTVKDLSSAKTKIQTGMPVEKLRGAVKAIIATNKLNSLNDQFKSPLDATGPGIRRDTEGHILMQSLAQIDDSWMLDDDVEEGAASGKMFNELYEMGPELGAGAFSVVKSAIHTQSEKEYAVKCVPRKDLHPSDAVALQDEITALRVLVDCPHIVTLRDVFDEPNTTYVVLERMHGGDLIDRIIEKAHYTEGDAKEVCKQLLQGVAYCHERRIANRNLKPENLLLVSKESDVDVRISDFGYAKKVLYPNSLRTQCGTEGYVAPEILEHRPAYDVQCDMWGLGVIIYIVLGGYRPFRGDPDEVMRQIRYGEYTFHKRYWSHVSEEAKHLIRRMLTVSPEERITAEEALKADWIASSDHNNVNLSANQEKMKEFKPKARFRQTVKMIIAANKLQSLGSRYRAFQDF